MLPLYVFRNAEKEPLYQLTETPATIEADQILLALQQLAKNNNSANFHNNINRNSKLPMSLTTTMPTLDGKTEKFELFEDLFQSSLKFHNKLTEEDRIKYFHSVMREDALQTYKNNNGPKRQNLAEILAAFQQEIRKTPTEGDSETQIPEICLQPSKSKIIRFS